MQNAAFSRAEKSLHLASVRGLAERPIAGTRMRRLFDPCVGPAREDILTAKDVDAQSDEEDSPYEARAASRKAEKKRRGAARKQNTNPQGANKIKGDRQVPNGFDRRTGGRNRCYTCDSKCPLAPKCPRRKQWKPTGMTNSPIRE